MHASYQFKWIIDKHKTKRFIYSSSNIYQKNGQNLNQLLNRIHYIMIVDELLWFFFLKFLNNFKELISRVIYLVIDWQVIVLSHYSLCKLSFNETVYLFKFHFIWKLHLFCYLYSNAYATFSFWSDYTENIPLILIQILTLCYSQINAIKWFPDAKQFNIVGKLHNVRDNNRRIIN